MELERQPDETSPYFSDQLGIRIEEYRSGYTRCTLKVRPELLNRLGVLHGGATYSLADTGMGAAVFSTLAEDQHCVAMEVKMNYLRPVTEGTLTAESRVAHRGQRVAVATCEIRNEAGRLVAMATGSFYLFTEEAT